MQRARPHSRRGTGRRCVERSLSLLIQLPTRARSAAEIATQLDKVQLQRLCHSIDVRKQLARGPPFDDAQGVPSVVEGRESVCKTRLRRYLLLSVGTPIRTPSQASATF